MTCIAADSWIRRALEAEARCKALELRVANALRGTNAEMERRRKFEAEANQAYCETALWKAEAERLRESLAVLGEYIAECCGNSGESVPAEVGAAMDALFPEVELAARETAEEETRG